MMRIDPAGRWGGKLTRRELPDDPSIEALDREDRLFAARAWLGRAASERRVADAFAVVRDALTSLDADPTLVALAARAIDDELRHTELSRLVASRYAGEDLASPPLLELSVPHHRGASDSLRHVLHVVGQSCMNETIASAFLEAAIARAESPFVVAVLHELLSDEIDHARIGWALLASDPSSHRAIEPWLPNMAIRNLRMWREAPRDYPESDVLAAHGIPPANAVEDAIKAAFQDLIVPGFEALAIDVTPVKAWLESGAPT